MAESDKGPILTSVIIFYLSIGAAIFQILEEPSLISAQDDYNNDTDHLLKKYPCLKRGDLDDIIQVSCIIWLHKWCLGKRFGGLVNISETLEKVPKCFQSVY